RRPAPARPYRARVLLTVDLARSPGQRGHPGRHRDARAPGRGRARRPGRGRRAVTPGVPGRPAPARSFGIMEDGPVVTVAIRVRPGASRTAVGGRYDGPFGPALVVAVQAPAVEGRATEAAVRAVARALGVK